MKELNVSDRCTGCGLCILSCSYLEENDEGNAAAIEGKIISDEDIEAVERVVSECPEGALSIVEITNTNKTGKDGINDLIEVLKRERDNFSVEQVSSRDLRFNPKVCDIPIPSSRMEGRKFKTKKKAYAAASDEFRSMCYSPNAYRPMLKKMFAEYKVNVLRPYYTCENSDDSVFYRYNKSIEAILRRIYNEAKIINGGSINLPESWCEFNVFPKKNGIYLEPLRGFEERSECSGIMNEFKTSGESADWYVDFVDIDSIDTYEGEDWLGLSKYSYEYYFTNFREAAQLFIDDLKTSAEYAADSIQEGAANLVNGILGEYKNMAVDLLNSKINDLSKL